MCLLDVLLQCVCVPECAHTLHTLLICVCTIVPSVCTVAAESVQIRAGLESVPDTLRLIQRMLEQVRISIQLDHTALG